MRVLYVDEQGRQEDYAKPIPQVMSGKEAFLASLDWSVHGWYVTRSSFYERWPYDDTCMSYSDDNTTRLHYYHSREVRFAQQARYYYFVYSQSVTQKATPRRFDYLRAVESMKNHLVALGVERKVMAFYESQRMQVLVGCYMFYHVHGHELSEEDRRFGLSELRHAWESIDRTLLKDEATAKFGYRPCRYWFLFRMQEWLYFTLRGFLGKNR